MPMADQQFFNENKMYADLWSWVLHQFCMNVYRFLIWYIYKYVSRELNCILLYMTAASNTSQIFHSDLYYEWRKTRNIYHYDHIKEKCLAFVNLQRDVNIWKRIISKQGNLTFRGKQQAKIYIYIFITCQTPKMALKETPVFSHQTQHTYLY